MGTAILPFWFSGERETHLLEFRVWPKYIHDVIFGSHFLRLTKTFKRSSHRINHTVKKWLSNRACFSGSAARISGILNGHAVSALPDTESDSNLIDEQFAQSHGYAIDKSPEQHIPLQIANDSYCRPTGFVEDALWTFGADDLEGIRCSIYGLPNLQCDALLSYNFLQMTKVLTKSSEKVALITTGLGEWTLSTNTQVPKVPKWLTSLRGKRRKPDEDAVASQRPEADGVSSARWGRSRRGLLTEWESNERAVGLLPLEQRDDARAAHSALWDTAWAQHMRTRPEAVGDAGGVTIEGQQPPKFEHHGVNASNLDMQLYNTVPRRFRMKYSSHRRW